jgi:hypothetical protein
MVRSLALLFGIVLFGAHLGGAQTTSATLQGIVRDGSGAVLPGVAVTVRNQDTGFTRTATSDGRGAYYVPFVPPGNYEIVAELSGFQTERRENVRFDVGQPLTIDLALSLAGVAEAVTVSAAAPMIEVTKSTVDQVITREQIDNLPLNGRNAAGLASLAPGVVQRPGTEEPVGSDGQPRGSLEIITDGVSNKLVLLNSIRSNTPPDAIEQFQVITGQYQAEFGNATGLVINTITRSGTNDLKGRGYYFHRDDSLDARNAFALTKASFEQKQGGGWLGGPIVRDRTHFFASYEGTRRKAVATVTSPFGPGDFDQPYANNQLLTKVDHQINQANRLSVRFSADHPEQKRQGVGGLNVLERGIDYLTWDRSYNGNLTTIFSTSLLNEARVQVSDAGIRIDVADPDGYTINRPSGMLGKPSNQPQRIPELRFQFVDNLSYERASHRLKFGVDINRVVADGFLYQNIPGVFQFTTDRAFDANDPATYPTQFTYNQGDPNFRFLITGASAFAQDSWLIRDNVTLNVGVRYDAWNMTGTDLRKTNFAPRLAATWDPFGDGKTSLRAGWGLFYNSVLANVPIFTAFFASQRTFVISNPGFPDPFSRGSANNTPPSTYIFQNDQPLPRAYHTTAGVQRELAQGLAISVDYTNAKGRDLLRMVDTNAVLPPSFTRPDPTRGFVNIIESTGFSNYHALLVAVNQRLSARGQFGVSYTLSSAKTTTEAENNILHADPQNINDSYAYGNNDQRHRVVINGSMMLPGRVQFSGLLSARSGLPFNITTGSDNNRNTTFNDRPDLAPGAEVGTDAMRERASFVDPGTRTGNLPRNAGRGDAFWQIDLRVSKPFTFQRYRLELLVEAFNLANRANMNLPNGNLSSSSFGRPTTADIARQVQLGARFGF